MMRHAKGNNRTQRPARSLVVAACAALVVLAAAGCRAKPKNFDNENDSLRRQVGQLESEVARLSAERNEAIAQREIALQQLSAATGEPAAAVVRSMPASAGIRIGRLTGGVAEADPERVDAVEVYIRPHDGRQRFVQVAGTMTVEVVQLAEPGAAMAMPALVGKVTLTPEQLREAYRSSVMGTHYAVRVPLDPPINKAVMGRFAITVLLEDAVSGQRHVATEVTDRVYTRSQMDL